MSDDLDEFYASVGQHAAPIAAPKSRNSVEATVQANGEWAKELAAASCWAESGNSYFPVTSAVDSIPPGAYRCCISDRGPFLDQMAINIDNLLHLPDSTTERLLDEFNQFWKLKELFDKRGFTFKRGMLMWGPPGSGKTSAVWQMTERLIKDKGGVVLFVEDPQIAIMCMNILRKIEPDRPIITVMEDIDAIIARHGDHLLLGLLDGEFQTNNVVHLATTNYPHMLDKRFIDRPSRFDTIMKVGMPSAAARKVYFTAKEPHLDAVTVDRWVRRTEDYSVAHLREVCIATQCFNQPEEAVFSRLDKMKEKIRLNEDLDEGRQVGFLPAKRKLG